MKVFWSWQSDTHQASGRHFVRAALEAAVERLVDHPGLEDAERPRVDSDTSNVPGSPPIAETILRKIRECAVFVADVTPIETTVGGKKLPNPNVMLELGYALANLGLERIILVMNQAEGASLRALPFDLRHWRAPLTYALRRDAPDDQKQEVLATLVDDLVASVGPCLAFVAANQTAPLHPEGVPADPGDPAIWDGAMPTVRVRSSPMQQESDLPVVAGPKLWCRIIPAGPVEASRQDVSRPRNGSLSLAPLGDYANLWTGVSQDGAAAWVWEAGQQKLNALTQWFQETGEIWGFWPDVLTDWQEASMFSDVYAARGLVRSLDVHAATLQHFGAAFPWRIKVGVRGLHGSVLPTSGRMGRLQALSDRAVVERMIPAWSETLSGDIAFEFIGRVHDAYGATNLTREAFDRMLTNG